MKSYDELKAEMEAIQQQMVEAKKNERANALREVKRLCKEFGFTAGMLKGGRSNEYLCARAENFSLQQDIQNYIESNQSSDSA